MIFYYFTYQIRSTFFDFLLVKFLITESTFTAFQTSFLIDNKAKLFNRSCFILDLKQALISFSLEKLLSPEATDAGMVKKI